MPCNLMFTDFSAAFEAGHEKLCPTFACSPASTIVWESAPAAKLRGRSSREAFPEREFFVDEEKLCLYNRWWAFFTNMAQSCGGALHKLLSLGFTR